jgi:hypothetical protein
MVTSRPRRETFLKRGATLGISELWAASIFSSSQLPLQRDSPIRIAFRKHSLQSTQGWHASPYFRSAHLAQRQFSLLNSYFCFISLLSLQQQDPYHVSTDFHFEIRVVRSMSISHYSAVYFTRKPLHLFAFSAVSIKSDINSYFFGGISLTSQTSPPQPSLSTIAQTSNINLTFINLFFIYHINQTYPSYLTLTPISFPLNSS